MHYEWKATDESKELFEGRDRETGEVKCPASRRIWSLVLTPSCVRWGSLRQ
ncbi:hypothetical protein ACNKHU_24905 [Shigella flexneri]